MSLFIKRLLTCRVHLTSCTILMNRQDILMNRQDILMNRQDILMNRQDACSTKNEFSCGVGILPARKSYYFTAVKTSPILTVPLLIILAKTPVCA